MYFNFLLRGLAHNPNLMVINVLPRVKTIKYTLEINLSQILIPSMLNLGKFELGGAKGCSLGLSLMSSTWFFCCLFVGFKELVFILGVFSTTEHLDHPWSNCLNLPFYCVQEQSEELFCGSIWGEENSKQIKARKQIFPAHPSYLHFPDAHREWNHTCASSFRREVATILACALWQHASLSSYNKTSLLQALLLFKIASCLLVKFIIIWLCFAASELRRAVQSSNM